MKTAALRRYRKRLDDARDEYFQDWPIGARKRAACWRNLAAALDALIALGPRGSEDAARGILRRCVQKFNRLDDGVWGNLPGSYHNGGINLSFADGHMESHRWQIPPTLLFGWNFPTAISLRLTQCIGAVSSCLTATVWNGTRRRCRPHCLVIHKTPPAKARFNNGSRSNRMMGAGCLRSIGRRRRRSARRLRPGTICGALNPFVKPAATK